MLSPLCHNTKTHTTNKRTSISLPLKNTFPARQWGKRVFVGSPTVRALVCHPVEEQGCWERAFLRLLRQSYINAQKRTARLAAIWRSSDWMKPKLTQLHWGERRGGDGGRRGRRCCFMLPDLQCHNREMLAYYKHCETKLRGFSNATLRLCWYEVFRLTCVHRYINSGSSLPCTVAVVVVIAAAAGAGLKQTNRCPSAHLPSPLSLSSPHDSKFFKRSPWVYIFTGCSAKLYSCLNGGL